MHHAMASRRTALLAADNLPEQRAQFIRWVAQSFAGSAGISADERTALPYFMT